jgi:DNA-binding LacI/PurR family transcriptional regulator
MSNPQKQPNIYDVARLAMVSHQTVSRVINDNASIRPETKLRVQKAMKTLGYRPNMAARALASSRSRMIGILSSDTDFTGPASMVHHMETAAREAGFVAVSCGVDPDSSDSVLAGIEHLMRLGIEGMAVVTPQSQAVDLVRERVDVIPVVTLDSMYRMDELAVSVDNFAGGAIATQHLIDLGHREILHIGGPKNWFESTTRAAGYTSTMLNANLVPQIIDGDWEIATGYRIARELDFDGRRITAIFVANDRMALGVMHACRERGLEVPGRLSLVGFDDLEETQYYWPPLTTLRQDFQELGERAMKLLLNELAGVEGRKIDRLVPQLVLRKSTAPAPLI